EAAGVGIVGVWFRHDGRRGRGRASYRAHRHRGSRSPAAEAHPSEWLATARNYVCGELVRGDQYTRSTTPLLTAPRPEGASASSPSACAATTSPTRAGLAGIASA